MTTRDDLPDEGVWFRVDPAGTVGAARRAAASLARQLGLPEQRAAECAIVVAEVTSNLAKHADDGRLLLRPVRRGGVAGIEIVAIDSGPGMADARLSERDGQSTAGTLGIGLGAIARQAGWWDTHSQQGRGTVLVAQVWPGAPPPPMWAAGVVRPLPGEVVCGDGHAAREVGGRRQLLVCDGLGHGPLAAAATGAALAAFAAAPAEPPHVVVEHLHRALRPTRGAALAVAELDGAARTVRYCGLGNVAGVVVAGDHDGRSLVSLPGIAGHQRRQVREFTYPLPPGAVVVMHTDGVHSRWDPADLPGLFDRAPLVIAAAVLRDAGLRRDDACVAVARDDR